MEFPSPPARVLPTFLLALLLSLGLASATTPPPEPRPVKVKVGFYLLNLNNLNERNETFDADLYLSLQWKDPRLAFEGTEPQVYLEEAAAAKLEEIWWPQLEYVNSESAEVTNQSLDIEPDGTVNYYIGLNGTFRADLDLRRFPFDQQTLGLRIGSFYWTADNLVFEQEGGRMAFEQSNSYEALRITGLTTAIRPTPFQVWGDDYSEYHVEIKVKRNFLFYMWTIFGPVTLIFLISCAVFYVPIDQFSDRISICLTSLLACIATQFAISFSLPQIDYLTIIDRVFVITYFCIALAVFLCVWSVRRYGGDLEKTKKIDHFSRIFVPSIYLLLLALVILL